MRCKPHEERVAPPSGRPLEVSGDRHSRWMAITALGAAQNSAYRPPRWRFLSRRIGARRVIMASVRSLTGSAGVLAEVTIRRCDPTKPL